MVWFEEKAKGGRCREAGAGESGARRSRVAVQPRRAVLAALEELLRGLNVRPPA